MDDVYFRLLFTALLLLSVFQLVASVLLIELDGRYWHCTASHFVGEPHDQTSVCDQYTRKEMR